MFNPISEADNNYQIKYLYLVPLTKQAPLYARPYVVSPHGDAIDELKDRVVRSGASSINTKAVADLTASLIQPSPVAYETDIDDRWMAQDRYIFMLKAVSYHWDGGIVNTYIHGFTNCDDVFSNGIDLHIAPDMIFDIKSVFVTAEHHYTTPQGASVRREILTEVYDVFKPVDGQVSLLQRPVDVIDGITNREYINSLGAFGDYRDDFGTFSGFSPANQFDASTPFSTTSNMSNNIGSYYLTTILNEGVKDRKVSEASHVTSRTANDYSGGAVSESTITNNRFINRLSLLEGHRGGTKGTFSYATLEQIDPIGAHDFELIDINKSDSRMDFLSSLPDYGKEWSGQGPDTIAATSILESTISLAALNGFYQLTIHMDSMNVNTIDESVVIALPTNTLLGINNSQKMGLLENIRKRFFEEVFIPETKGGVIPMAADIYVNMFGDTKIYLSMYGERGEWYTLPTVVKPHGSLVTTIDERIVSATTDLFGELIKEIADDTNLYDEY